MTVNLNSRTEKPPVARPAGQGSASGLNRPVRESGPERTRIHGPLESH